ncbi:GLPGLI family protein [Empedobacter stercoris]|nr:MULTISPECIES: GLPGLI family protein [Empedobacter]MCA4775721.1 GLPGLI family protein [Empedobacter stercoris]MCA4808225.1 GLPGLI family protein [Empedobacter stercoris]MDM1522797.1 GLPGLI family protein [Empedobacter sp. 225-1]MDM1542857.1 GLPGLI family protein [Empedobacter sp. 189-2]QNT14367.1 GLPGLI family protein [Empedobacter stercoris]
MLKYLFILLPIIGVSQDAIRVEYEVRQEFDKSNLKQLSVKQEEMLSNSENKRYYFELVVNNLKSNYTEIERINNEQNRGTSFGLTTNISATIFKDFNAKELYENSIMKPKLFIKDSIQSFPWILSKEESTILGYKVRKAIYTNSTQTVEAWYAPDLPFRDGPSRFNGLPGLILKIKFKLPFISDMDTNVSFTAIHLKPYAGKIEIPNKSKKVTKEEYDKEIEKSMGKSGGIINQGVEKD